MVTGGSFPDGKAAGAMKLTTDQLVEMPRMVELYIHFPIRLHGVVLNLVQHRDMF
jgi:hypothetical protein